MLVTKKTTIALGTICIVLAGVIALALTPASVFAENEEPKKQEVQSVYLDKLMRYQESDIQKDAQQQGFNTPQELYTAIEEQRAELRNDATNQFISDFDKFLTDEDKQQLKEYESQIFSGTKIAAINNARESYNKIVDKAIAKQQRATVSYTSNSSVSYASGSSGVLTKSGGVNYFNNRRETWYSQKVLPGGGLRIPGRHVNASDGTVRDGDGYICVAASDLPKGSVVQTSLGAGKVYDTGCAAGTTDIYVNW